MADFICIYLFLMAMGCSYLLLRLTRGLFCERGFLDQPGQRKIHQTAIPPSGGIGIMIALMLITGLHLALLDPFKEFLVRLEIFRYNPSLFTPHEGLNKLVAVFAGGVLIWISGLLDDLNKDRDMALFKFSIQLAAASTLVLLGDLRISFLPWDWANILVSLLWITGVTNAFNLLDNMDGLSAGTALTTSIALFLSAFIQGQYLVCFFMATLAGSLCGFLPHNFNQKKKIFLGDNGALFLGFMISSITLFEDFAAQSSNSLYPILIPLLVLTVPLADTFTVIITRIKNRKPVWVGDTNHLSHRLVRAGFNNYQAVALLCLINLSCGLGSVVLLEVNPLMSMVVVLNNLVSFLLLFLLILFKKKARKEPVPDRDHNAA